MRDNREKGQGASRWISRECEERMQRVDRTCELGLASDFADDYTRNWKMLCLLNLTVWGTNGLRYWFVIVAHSDAKYTSVKGECLSRVDARMKLNVESRNFNWILNYRVFSNLAIVTCFKRYRAHKTAGTTLCHSRVSRVDRVCETVGIRATVPKSLTIVHRAKKHRTVLQNLVHRRLKFRAATTREKTLPGVSRVTARSPSIVVISRRLFSSAKTVTKQR